MEISNLEFGRDNSIAVKNKSYNKRDNDSLVDNKFSQFLRDTTSTKKTSKFEVESKSRCDKDSSRDKLTERNKTTSEHMDNVQKKDEDSTMKELSRENKSSATEKVDDITKDTIDIDEKSTKESQAIEEAFKQLMNLIGADLLKLVNTAEDSKLKDELTNAMNFLNIENNKSTSEADNKLSVLLNLLEKVSNSNFPDNLVSEIFSKVENGLSQVFSENNLVKPNRKFDSASLVKLSDNIDNDASQGLKENSEHKELLKSILEKLKTTRKDDSSIYNSRIFMEPDNSKNYSLNNIYVEKVDENGVSVKKNNENLTDGLVKQDTSNKEEALLRKLVEGDKSDTKLNRVTNFINVINDNRIDFSSPINDKMPIHISKGTFNEDIVKAVKFMDLNGIKDLSVKIYPKELGEVLISVTMEQGALKAVIKATNKDAVEMLNLGLRDINEKINLNNSKIQSVDIGLYNEDTTYFANGNLSQEQHQQSRQFYKKADENLNLAVEDESYIKETQTDNAVNLLI